MVFVNLTAEPALVVVVLVVVVELLPLNPYLHLKGGGGKLFLEPLSILS